MLTVRNLSKTYPNGVQALRDVSLDIPRGMFGLLGPNGAGKSTLMRTIATLQDSDTGSVHLEDLDVLVHRDEARRVLGYLPQDFGLYPRVSAEALLDHFAALKGIAGTRERTETVHSLLQLTNLWEVRKQKLGTFSGGMRQRFGIAQALIGDPRLIIVDEPTAGLDPEERRRFLNLLSAIGESVVVILSTHIVEDVREICSHMAIIDQGRVLMTGAPQQAVAEFAGKIWQKVTDRDEADGDGAGGLLVSTHRVAGRIVIHRYGDAPPGNGYAPVDADLEDVYFATLARARLQAGTAAGSAD